MVEFYRPDEEEKQGLIWSDIGNWLVNAARNVEESARTAQLPFDHPYAVGGVAFPERGPTTGVSEPTVMPPPAEATPDEGPTAQWRKFVEMGGTQMKYKDGTIIKYSPPKSEAEKAQKKVAAGQAQGQPQGPPQQQPGGQGVSPQQPQPSWGQITTPPPPVQPGGPPPIPSYQETEEQQRQMAQQYSRAYTPANAPLTSQGFQEARNAEAARARMEKEAVLATGYPSRGELLKGGYEATAARMSKGQRVMMSILTQDLFYTDKLAGAEAEYEKVRRGKIAEGKGNIIEIESAARLAALDKMKDMEDKERAVVAADLKQRLITNPKLTERRDFARDYAIAHLGISEDRVDKYVDDHYNSKTKTYDLIIDPYRETLKTAANGANAIQQIIPTLPREAAMAIGLTNPTMVLKIATDELAALDVKIQHYKGDPRGLQELQNRRKEVAVIREGYATNPLYRTLVELKAQRESPGWGSMSQPAKKEWEKKVNETYTALTGLPPDRDPERLYRDGLLQEKQIQHYADIHREAIKKEIEDKKALPPKDKLIKAIGDPQFITGKNKDYDIQQRMRLKTLEDSVRSGELDNPKSETVTQADRDVMTAYRNHIFAELPVEARQSLGTLTNREAVAIADDLERAHATGRPYSPKVEVARILAERRRIDEENAKKGKKR